MRLLKCNSAGQLSLTKDLIGNTPNYAILSHTWGPDTEEVTFGDLMNGTGKNKAGYDKIRFCGEQARLDGLQYFWVDVCCINISNNIEISEAINSMFRWYRNSAKCYVYLSDVSIIKRKASDRFSEFTWESAFRASVWFRRGWTLQELLAPSSVEFFSREGKRLGDKRTLEQQVHEITGIAVSALQGASLSNFSVEERLSWGERRQTTRGEDAAYSLLGIFDVNLPLIYGEGREKAFRRLMKEIDTSAVSLAPLKVLQGYRPLKDSGFRILILNPGMEGSPIKGYIEEFDLLEPPHYNALSYFWGHEPAIHRIDINYEPTLIRPNLFHALQRMRARTHPVYLWVDSLCINQSSEIERSAQVRQMADIYQNARNVWIWLGEEDLTSKTAMEFIPKIVHHNFRWDGGWWEKYEFTALEHILGRSWFRRRWVIQEAAFSANSVIFCGGRQVSMNDLACAVSQVRMRLDSVSLSSSVAGKNVPLEEFLPNFRDSPATRLLDIIQAVFQRSDNGAILTRRLSLETLVELGIFCETTDQRDTIFALLSLANDAGSLSQPYSTDYMVPDYGSNLLDVFANFIMHCCHRSGSLDIICRPWAPVSPSSMNTAGQIDRAPLSTIPSWIAFRDSLPFGNPSWGTTRRLHGKPLVGSSQKRLYNAHCGTKPQVYLGRNMNPNTCDGSLYAKGIVLGEITQRSTRMANAIITNDCLDILGAKLLDQQLNSANLSDSIWRVLCADRDDRGEPAQLVYRSAMVQLLQLSSEAPLISDDCPDQVNLVSSIDIEELLETKLPEDVGKFLKIARDVLWNRRTFRGKRNDSSSSLIVGLVP